MPISSGPTTDPAASGENGVMIHGQPTLIATDSISQWINEFFQEASVFRPPQAYFEQYLTGPNGFGDFFRSTLPALPPIEIGQFQWPCVGASRYARALFLVDNYALFQILNEAWGISIPTSAYPWNVTDTWVWSVTSRNRAVEVTLAEDFNVPMYVLTPIKISTDVWILPLVDGRYFRLGDVKENGAINPDVPSTTWTTLFTSFNAATYPYDVDFTPESGEPFLRPDPIFFNPQVPTGFLVDAACFAVGCRPVVPFPSAEEAPVDFPELEILDVLCQRPSTAATIKTALLDKTERVTGGTSGKCRVPKSITIGTRYSKHYYNGENKSVTYKRSMGAHGSELYLRSTVNRLDVVDESVLGISSYSSFENYVEKIVEKWADWNKEEHYLTLADIVELEPGGFDDYIIYESSSRKKTTTVRSLASDFVPAYLLAQHKGGSGIDDPAISAIWYHVERQSVVAKLTTSIAAGGVTVGVRNGVYGLAQIIDPALMISGSRSSGVTYARAVVPVLNGEARSLPSGTIVHLAWFDDVVMPTGSSLLPPEPYQGWVIEWADC